MKILVIKYKGQPGFPGEDGVLHINSDSIDWMRDIGDNRTLLCTRSFSIEIEYTVEELLAALGGKLHEPSQRP